MEPTASRISSESQVSHEQIHELIELRGFGELKSALGDMDVHDLAELLGELLTSAEV